MGVELDLPINRFRERNQYRSTIISFEAALRRLSLALDNKRNNIRLGLRSLKQFEQNYEIQKISVELAAKRAAGASLNYQAGRANVDQIVRAQDDLVAARNNMIRTMVNYLDARMALLLEIGILRTERESFWINEAAVVVDLVTGEPKPEDPAQTPDNQEEVKLLTPDELFQ
jgi:outer membrane protein TolC